MASQGILGLKPLNINKRLNLPCHSSESKRQRYFKILSSKHNKLKLLMDKKIMTFSLHPHARILEIIPQD